MSLARNTLAVYASQVWLAVLGLATLPVYMRLLGPEAYGVVAFFVVLQSWFQLLDLGLSPALTREAARLKGGQGRADYLRGLLRRLELLFACMALAGGAALALAAPWIARHWLQASHVDRELLVEAIQLMAMCIGLRWVGELHRGVIAGFERQQWLAGFAACIGTARHGLALIALVWMGPGIDVFFRVQLLLSLAELAGLLACAYRVLPAARAHLPPWRSMGELLRFSATLSAATVVWVAATQSDRLLLSGWLPLADYGWFSLVVSAAGAILTLTAPIAAVLLPRLTALHAQDRPATVAALYRRATRWAAAVALPSAALLVFHAERALQVWTGDPTLAHRGAATLSLYAVGNALLALSAFPYFLQYVLGRLGLHLLATTAFMLVFLPLLAWGASRAGPVGAGWAWLLVNALYFMLWPALAHRRFAAVAVQRHWLLRDIVPGGVAASAVCAVGAVLPLPADRTGAAVAMGLLWVAAAGASYATAALLDRWLPSGALAPAGEGSKK